MINYNYISLYQFQYLFNNEILIVEDHCSVTICSKQASSKKKNGTSQDKQLWTLYL